MRGAGVRWSLAPLLSLSLVGIAPAADAKIKTADDMAAAKAYLLVEVDPVEVKLLGTSQITTGVIFAPYDPTTRQVQAGVTAAKDPVAKDGKRRLYLIEIDPGTWVIAGTGASGAPLGSANTSFSLGSYHFEAKAGELVDLGVFQPAREDSDNPDTKMSVGKLLGGPLFGGRVEPVPNRLDIRPRGDGDVAVCETPDSLTTAPHASRRAGVWRGDRAIGAELPFVSLRIAHAVLPCAVWSVVGGSHGGRARRDGLCVMCIGIGDVAAHGGVARRQIEWTHPPQFGFGRTEHDHFRSHRQLSVRDAACVVWHHQQRSEPEGPPQKFDGGTRVTIRQTAIQFGGQSGGRRHAFLDRSA